MHNTDELHRLWELLLSKLAEKGMKLQQALVLVQFLRHCDEVMFWIRDKVHIWNFHNFLNLKKVKKSSYNENLFLGNICVS